MSIFVGVRLPDLLNSRVEEESVKQGKSKSAAIIALLEKALLLPSERVDAPAEPKLAASTTKQTAALDEWAIFDKDK